ncbi:MAG: glycoside hydrolase family 9 protein [Saprospiraceae bacterium]
MNKLFFIAGLFAALSSSAQSAIISSWIRINQLGYQPGGVKVAVLCSKYEVTNNKWQLVDVITQKAIINISLGKNYGVYGPFSHTYRLNFSSIKKPGRYYLKAGKTTSPEFEIDENVYHGAADFCMRYMRQQRSGFNPFLKDSCHTHDGYVLYGVQGGIKDSTHIDVTGGWHDASDYLQYSTTSANATYHLLAAYRDFPQVFGDEKLGNGLDGKNGMPDVLDEAKWGLDWLLKMHPRPNWLFNQLGDDRDHMGMRIPKEDSNYYGKGLERPVYFINGEPQQRGKFMNNTTGTSSTAGKFASAFALGAELMYKKDAAYSDLLSQKSIDALTFANKKPGVTQTVSVKSPYIYAEDNWVDDMELAESAIASMLNNEDGSKKEEALSKAELYARQETVTPWLGRDTAKHYQWYPFINIGHYELAKQLTGNRRDTITGYYKKGIELVWNKAKQNAFYRGIPFIWCSNNLTTSFATQCYWYRQLTGDKMYDELEQANFDWLFGCNPWGTSMVYGLPAWGDTPVDPHSAFTHLKNYPIDGGLVDGPVYSTIYNNLIGITLYQPDEYAAFQSKLAVYHDDYGDYSTNEPTMDGTASLIYLLAAKESGKPNASSAHMDNRSGMKSFSLGAIIRGDSTKKNIALVFSGHEFAEGGELITKILRDEGIKASFFFTGDFYRNKKFSRLIKTLKAGGHYLGAHSDKHLLYCDWSKRDSLLVSKKKFNNDVKKNYESMRPFGISKSDASFFLPAYEWYNDSIAAWTKEMNLQLVNYTPGTLSNADYTTPEDKNYRSSEKIYHSIINFENSSPSGLNGFMLLMHCGTDSKRTDKFYDQLPKLIYELKLKGYHFETVQGLLKAD